MNITHIIFSLQVGGAESIMIDIINNQVNLGNKVNLIVINNEINKTLLNNISKEIKLIFINRPEGSINLYYFIKLYYELIKLKTDIIHSHSIPIGKILKYLKVKKVITVHDIGKASELLNFYDNIFAISKSVKEDIFKNTSIVSTLVYNGIETSAVKRNKTILNQRRTFKIVQISRLRHDKKGQDLLIRALYILKNEFNLKHFECDFIGEGSSLEHLKNLTIELKLENNINFLGVKSREYIYQNLCNYDLLVQPSRYEGFGLTVIEAMLANIPVLVSNIEGPLELIRDGKYGFYFEKENISELSEKLIKIINDFPKESFLINSYTYAKKSYDISQTVNEYLINYKK